MHGEFLIYQQYQRFDSCRFPGPFLHSVSMKDIIYLLFHLLTTIAKLIRPGGSRAVIARQNGADHI